MSDENLAAVLARIERSARLTEGEADDVSGYQVTAGHRCGAHLKRAESDLRRAAEELRRAARMLTETRNP